MEEIILNAELREEIGKPKIKHMRDAGFVPAIIYAQGQDAKSVKVSRHELITLAHQHRLENTVVNLKLKGDKQKAHPCLVKEIQYDPVNDDILHLDFNEVSLTKTLKINVPIEATGEPVGVKQEGGSLEHILWEIEVECLPTDIPSKIIVDVSALKMGESIHVKDIKLPPNVKVITSADTILLSVVEPMKEEAPAEVLEGEAASQEPEVIKEKKEVPEEEQKEKEPEKK